MKSLVSGGSDTKIVALGIGGGVEESELKAMASLPTDVFHVQDFSSLPFVEERLRNESCIGSLIYLINTSGPVVTGVGRPYCP